MKRFLLLGVIFIAGLAFAEADKKEGTVISTGKKVLVVFYSRTGNTEKVGKDIAQALGADVEKIIDKKPRSGFIGYIAACKDAYKKNLTEIEPVTKDIKSYDLIVVGSPIWAGTMAPAIRTFLTQYKSDFKNIALYTTAGGTKFEKVIPKVEEVIEKKVVAATGILQNELKKKDIYDKKLNDFVGLLK
jgi:flavodoxin